MRFLYKIYSGYNGFTPGRIRERMLPGRRLRLGWDHYLDEVEIRDEVWVHFRGPGVIAPGVYVMGSVREIDTESRSVLIFARRFSPTQTLTDAATGRRVAETVAPRGRQVFLVPEAWRTAPDCDVERFATSCAERRCTDCATWRGLMIVGRDEYRWPHRLPGRLENFVPAYWAIPRRSYVYTGGRRPSTKLVRTSDLFMRFKLGDQALAFPLALGMYTALKRRGLRDFDCVVPYPLSPEKRERGEFDRARALASELAALIGCRHEPLLRLTASISKKALRTGRSFSAAEFEEALLPLLEASGKAGNYRRILLVDDVCTDGSTLRCGAGRLWEVNSTAEVVGATAALMVKVPVVSADRRLLRDLGELPVA